MNGFNFHGNILIVKKQKKKLSQEKKEMGSDEEDNYDYDYNYSSSSYDFENMKHEGNIIKNIYINSININNFNNSSSIIIPSNNINIDNNSLNNDSVVLNKYDFISNYKIHSQFLFL